MMIGGGWGQHKILLFFTVRYGLVMKYLGTAGQNSISLFVIRHQTALFATG
jgi:hypothetical protein